MSFASGLNRNQGRAGDKGLRLNMWESLRLAWADDDLNARLKFILIMMAIFVLGVHIPVPVPGVDPAAMVETLKNNQIFGLLDTFGGGAFRRISILALGLGPYITASIIMQVLTFANPAWKAEMRDGGQYARQQQNKRTRVLTLFLGVFQGWGLTTLISQAVGLDPWKQALIVAFWTVGTMIMLWMGEQLTEKGISNGTSMLIFAGIVISLPNIVMNVVQQVRDGVTHPAAAVGLLVLFYATCWFVVMFTVAQRRIPIQHTRRNFGTKSVGGQTSYLPITVNMAGVIPIIFAVTLIYLPSQLEMAFQGPAPQVAEIFRTIGTFLMPDFTKWQGLVGLVLYSALIFMFTYFWTAIQYNVDDLTDNLRKSGSYITGIRPGRQTKEFLDKVISRVTTIGAMFLAVAAMTQYIFPLVVRNQQVAMLAGTSLLIMVSVALEVMRQIEAHLITKQYEGG